MELNSYTLEEYLGKFPEKTRDAILESILKTNMVRRALDSTEGKAILMECAQTITENIISILRTAVDKNEGEKARKIEEYARDISVTHSLMARWANIISQGDTHTKTMRKPARNTK